MDGWIDGANGRNEWMVLMARIDGCMVDVIAGMDG